jgi:hypothetical protein
LIRIPP